MAAEQYVLEISGEDVEKAIEAGLEELGLGRAEVDIEVLDEGSSGFLGIGSREATVRLTAKSGGAIGEALEVEVEPVVGEAPATLEADVAVPAAEGELQEDEVALEIVETLLNKMQIETMISVYQTEPDDLTGTRRWVIDIRGEDLGVLIGPRGETLNALQYVARLMTGHLMRQRTSFIVDVGGYRERREKALARLAERMAGKVVARGRPLTLEPMPPNERRIIHLTLRDDERVYTESTGEGRRRKVRIYPKS